MRASRATPCWLSPSQQLFSCCPEANLHRCWAWQQSSLNNSRVSPSQQLGRVMNCFIEQLESSCDLRNSTSCALFANIAVLLCAFSHQDHQTKLLQISTTLLVYTEYTLTDRKMSTTGCSQAHMVTCVLGSMLKHESVFASSMRV